MQLTDLGQRCSAIFCGLQDVSKHQCARCQCVGMTSVFTMQQNLQGDAYRLHPVLQQCLLISLQGASHVDCVCKPLSMKLQRTILHLHTGSHNGRCSGMAAAKHLCYAAPITCRTMHCCRSGKATAYCTHSNTCADWRKNCDTRQPHITHSLTPANRYLHILALQ